MQIKLKIKPKKLAPMCLQPIVGPLGLSSKDIIKDIESRLKNVEVTMYKHYYYILHIDIVQRKYELEEMNQPDSRMMIKYSLENKLNTESIKTYAVNTLGYTYANTLESRIKELYAVVKSCKLNVIK